MTTNSLDKSKIKFLLLEGIHSSAVEILRAAGYTQIETMAGRLSRSTTLVIWILHLQELQRPVLQLYGSVICACAAASKIDMPAAA